MSTKQQQRSEARIDDSINIVVGYICDAETVIEVCRRPYFSGLCKSKYIEIGSSEVPYKIPVICAEMVICIDTMWIANDYRYCFKKLLRMTTGTLALEVVSNQYSTNNIRTDQFYDIDGVMKKDSVWILSEESVEELIRIAERSGFHVIKRMVASFTPESCGVRGVKKLPSIESNLFLFKKG